MDRLLFRSGGSAMASELTGRLAPLRGAAREGWQRYLPHLPPRRVLMKRFSMLTEMLDSEAGAHGL